MPIEIGPRSNLKLEELTSIIATIIDRPAKEVEDWVILVKLPCGRCGRQYCSDGPLLTLDSRTGVTDDGVTYCQPAFQLHMLAKLAESLAEQWDSQ